MKPFLILSALMLFNTNAFAIDDSKMKEGANYCNDKEAVQKSMDLLARFSKDEEVIRLVGLRVGLCKLVDDKKITLDQAIDSFDHEKSRTMQKRAVEEMQSGTPKQL